MCTSNITVFDLITAHTPISAQSGSLQITASVLFVYFFIKAYVVGTHLNCIIDAIQMSTHNICIYNENKKKLHNHHQISVYSDLFL